MSDTTRATPDQHPDPERFWRRLRHILYVGVFIVVGVLATAVYAYLWLDRTGADDLMRSVLWAGVLMIVLYGARDGVQSFLERWK